MDYEETLTLERLEKRIELLEARVYGQRTSAFGDNNNSCNSDSDSTNNNQRTIVETLTNASELFRETVAYRQSINRLRNALLSVRSSLMFDTSLPEFGERAATGAAAAAVAAAQENDPDRFETMKRIVDSYLDSCGGSAETIAGLRSLAARLIEIDREFDRVSGTIEQLLDAKRAARQCEAIGRRHMTDIDSVRGSLKVTFQKYVRLSSIFFGVLQRLSTHNL